MYIRNVIGTASIGLLFFALFAYAAPAIQAAEKAALHDRIGTLRSLERESFEWQLYALDIARVLKSMPPSPERSKAQRAFKPQVEAFVRRDAQAAADKHIRSQTDAWTRRIGHALAGQGLEMQVRWKEARGNYVASIDYKDMNAALAKTLATETGLSDSARKAGFDRLEFVNSATAKRWDYRLDGASEIRAQVLRQAATEWGLDEL